MKLSLFNKSIEKLVNRILIIFLNGFNSIIILFGNILISYCVVSSTSSALWGGFVKVVIVLDIAFNVISWGSRHYLIRDFSLMPQTIITSWQISTKSRLSILLLFIIVILFLDYSLTIKGYLILWSLARFLYQSFDPIILFNRNFIFSLSIEIIGLLLVIVPVFIIRNELNLEILILLYTVNMCFKCLVLTFYYKRFFKGFDQAYSGGSYFSQSLKYFAISFPFLLLTFSGMLQSKTDLYSVAYFLDKKELAQYSIFMGFLGFSQFIASQFLSPFAKSIFRLNKRSLRRLERLFVLSGFGMCLLLETVAYFLFQFVYKFHFSPYMYSLGYLYMMLFYFYLVKNYEFGKANKQTRVAVFSLLCSLVNFLFSIFLIPKFRMEGALLAGIFGQVFLVIIFRMYEPKDKRSLNVLLNG